MKNIVRYLSLVICSIMILTACGSEAESADSLSLQSSIENASAMDENNSETPNSNEETSETSTNDESTASEGETSTNSESDASENETSNAPVNNSQFYVYYTEDEVDFSKAPKAEISRYPWGDEYTPYAYGQVIFKKDDGFYIHMYCEESNPQTTIFENGGTVYKDSCMEFFCDYRPQSSTYGGKDYINLEMNSAGVYLANFRGRSFEHHTNERITVTSEKGDTYWTVTAHVPLKLIEDLYGSAPKGIGDEIRCNFTKCGSGTDIPHYGTWRPLLGDTPNFHQPKLFKKVKIA
jgi:hypothetical protein